MDFASQQLIEKQLSFIGVEIYCAPEEIKTSGLGEVHELVLNDKIVLPEQNFKRIFDDLIVDRI